jgi:hypothetical protein
MLNSLPLESTGCQIEGMTISKLPAVGIAFVILALGVGIGRFATPTKVLERDRIVTSERDTELTWHTYVGNTENRVQTQTRWQTITKWEKDGSVTQTQVAAQATNTETKTAVAENSGTIKERIVEKIIEHERLVESKKPDWALIGRAGLAFDNLKPVYGVEIQRRILGPILLGLWAQGSTFGRAGSAGGLTVGFTF